MSYLDKMIDNSLSTNNRIFNSDTYLSLLNPDILPDIDELPFLEGNIKIIFNAYQSLLSGWTKVNLVIGGPQGSGKTSSIKLVERSFVKRNLIQLNSSKNDIARVIHVDCEEYNTYSQVVQYIIKTVFPQTTVELVLRDVNIKNKTVPTRGLSAFDYYSILKRCFSIHKLPTLFVFDNFDAMKSKQDSDSLINMIKKVEASLDNTDEQTKISIIVVLASLKNLSNLLYEETLTYFYRIEVSFKRYNAEQIITILQMRQAAFLPDTVGYSVLQMIGEHVEEVNGCAKYAINLLRDSARLAQENMKSLVGAEDVLNSIKRYSLNNFNNVMHELSIHQKYVLRSAYSNNIASLSTDSVYQTYQRYCKDIQDVPKNYRTVARYLQLLVERGILRKSRRIGAYKSGVRVEYSLSDNLDKKVVHTTLEQI